MSKWPKRKVLIDTREQTPWPWPAGCSALTTLKYGDYTIDGLEDVVRIERKSLPDLVGSLSPKVKENVGPDARTRRQRLKDELQWLGENVRHPYLVIEGDLHSISNGHYQSMMHPSAVIGALVSWSIRFNVHVIFAGNRAAAWAYANRILRKVEELHDLGELNDEQDRRQLDDEPQCPAGAERNGNPSRARPGTIRRLLLSKARGPSDQQES